MNFPYKYRTILIRSGKIFGFIAAIICTTALTFKSGTITNTSTVAFCFLIIVLLSAFFGDLLVAIITSITATLCFDYFYLPPVGKFSITAFSDWISLAAFLLTSVIISRLAASAAGNNAKTALLDKSLFQLKEFGTWLLSVPGDQLSLSKIAEETLRIFSLEYCSIHMYGEGKWHHFTGAAATSDILQQIENHLDFYHDHKADLMEIVDENLLGVQYMKINRGNTSQAMLVVKTETLSTNTISTIASMIGIRLM